MSAEGGRKAGRKKGVNERRIGRMGRTGPEVKRKGKELKWVRKGEER